MTKIGYDSAMFLYKGADMSENIKTEFRIKLENLINQESMENGSNTPDFILAEYLCDCLKIFDKATRRREIWYEKSIAANLKT